MDKKMYKEVYKGNDDYVFISYSHKDSDVVRKAINQLMKRGCRVWFDEGIKPSVEWSEEIADRLIHSTTFIVFISEASVESFNVRSEITYAFTNKKQMLAVHLEETELTPGLSMQMGIIQAVMAYEHPFNNVMNIVMDVIPKTCIDLNQINDTMPKNNLEKRYHVDEVIRTAVFTELFLAHDKILDEPCIIKKYNDDQELYRYELDALKCIRSGRVPRIRDVIDYDQEHKAVVMDHIDGISLKAMIKDKTILDGNHLMMWMIQLAEILDMLHNMEEPIIHCDIKPGNLVIGKEGRLNLVDFSVAINLSKSNKTIGYSPRYGAPELKDPETVVGPSIDIYGYGKTFAEVVDHVAGGQSIPINNGIKKKILPVIDRCIQDNPEDRYGSMLELLEDLKSDKIGILSSIKSLQIFGGPRSSEIELKSNHVKQVTVKKVPVIRSIDNQTMPLFEDNSIRVDEFTEIIGVDAEVE